MWTIPPDTLLPTAANAPRTTVLDIDAFRPHQEPGASQYRHTLPGGENLDALLINKESDTLVVTFHGALDRSKFAIPRYERLKSTDEFPVSALYIADPALWRHDALQLSWFTGWKEFDLPRVLADWAVKAAQSIGAARIVFTGSSGGGFAALQTSALVPGSLAVPFNPQTSVYGYLANGEFWGAQRDYARAVWPELAPQGQPPYTDDWTITVSDRLSAIRRYAKPTLNHVLYVSNVNDFHHRDHYVPFSQSVATSPNAERVQLRAYEGSHAHNPPTPEVFRRYMQEALELIGKLPTFHDRNPIGA